MRLSRGESSGIGTRDVLYSAQRKGRANRRSRGLPHWLPTVVRVQLQQSVSTSLANERGSAKAPPRPQIRQNSKTCTVRCAAHYLQKLKNGTSQPDGTILRKNKKTFQLQSESADKSTAPPNVASRGRAAAFRLSDCFGLAPISQGKFSTHEYLEAFFLSLTISCRDP